MCLILHVRPTYTVPSPSVSISHDGGTESLYSGTSLTLTCVVNVSSSAVDISQVVVNSTCSKVRLSSVNSSQNCSDTVSRVFQQQQTPSCLLSTSVHLTMQLTVEYTAAQWHCLRSVTIFEGSSTNQSINITVQSELMMHEVTMCDFMRSFSWSELPDPVIDIIRNGSTIIGTELSLHCSVDHVDGLINPPIIIWSWVPRQCWQRC